ncbi:MAG TPA: pilus assembly protein TadG-related protein [Anaerolineae bacterium]|nr:pilus assembly protein TadG-related protein [Anaerolineae bacterium]
MMKTRQQPPPPHRDESGQAALVVALFFFFVFLVFASLGVDGAAFYLTRRDLQSVADAAALAACTVLTQPQGEGVDQNALAIEEAKNTIAANYGSWEEFAGLNPPTTNLGVGVDLLKGIEVSDPQVRVALQRDVPTVLTQFVGRTSTTVTAQARCDSRLAGGVMPIAIQRYDGAPDGTLRDYIANKNASGYPPANPPWPYPSDSVTVTVDGRYGPFQVPWPKPEYLAKDGDLMDWQSGPEVSLVGQASETNNTAGSMSGFVMLDIRNVGSGNALEYYHGADGQANTMKDIGEMHINSGYQPPFPEVGSQVALLEGVSAAFAPQGMWDAGYRVGDVIAAIIYDGYVWTTPDFKITLTPSPGDSYGIKPLPTYPDNPLTAVTYDVEIARDGAANAKWYNPLDFDLAFSFSEPSLPSGTHVWMTKPDGTSVELTGPDYLFDIYGVQEALGWNGTLSIYSDSAGPLITQTVKYLSGLNVIADSSSGSTRGTASNYGFGAIGVDYSVSTSGGRLVVREGGSATAYLTTFGSAGVTNSKCRNLDATAELVSGGSALPWNVYFSSNPAFRVTIKSNDTDTASLALSALDNAPTGDYVLRLNGPTKLECGGPHSLDIPLTILPPASNATPNKYVIVQGYAAFRISYMDANDVKGYAISRIYLDPSELQYGLRPRLVPWG